MMMMMRTPQHKVRIVLLRWEVSIGIFIFLGLPMKKSYTHWAKHNEKVTQKKRKSEMKTKDQIVKARIIADKKRQKQKKGKNKKGKRKSHK